MTTRVLTSSNMENSTNLTFTNQYLNNYMAEKRLLHTVLLSIIISIGCYGNMTVIIIFHCVKTKWRAEKFFINALAWTDLVALIHSLIGMYIQNFYSVFYLEEYTCKLTLYLSVLSQEVSVYLLAVIAYDRYRLVCKPCRLRLNIRQKRIAVAVSYILAAIICFPVLFYSGTDEISINIGSKETLAMPCRIYRYIEIRTLMYIGFAFHFVAVCLGIICYVFVGRTLFKKTRSNDERIPSPTTETKGVTVDDADIDSQGTIDSNATTDQITSFPTSKRNNNEREEKNSPSKRIIRYNFTLMFISIFILNITASTIQIILRMVSYKQSYLNYNDNAWALSAFTLFQRSGIFVHAFDPFIYAYFDLRIREEAMRLCCRCCGLKRRQFVL